ncbi:hypothetical protein P261_01647 [Lachnospiraceae bacterium TWA4]|nr:hypothetical protein P261_01647 [Lachnospiraceae bacterium TWA4]
MELKKLPIGIEDFKDFKGRNYYYIDKTGMIKELLENPGKVNLFTRPRRFGKSLTMSMLKYFFEIGTDASLFEGLEISKNKDLCNQYLGQYPVISLSLKQVSGLNFEEAKEGLWEEVRAEARRYYRLLDAERLNEEDAVLLKDLRMGRGNLANSIKCLSELLYYYYNKKVIILIDEYDVPLQKADKFNYYPQMVELISQFFGSSMKTNPYMEFAVVTGCLRIAKESIFTGFNNPKIYTIVDEIYDEWFGFTDSEVQKLLDYYGKSEYYELTKKWYDGYRFGNTLVYCPWDVMNFCNQLKTTTDTLPRNFWANSSGNDIIFRFANLADDATRMELEELMQGKSIWKKVNLELTYREIDDDIENLWSVLFMTGYLTYKNRDDEGRYELVLPNQEVTVLFKEIVKAWFKERVKNDIEGLTDFFEAIDTTDAFRLEDNLNSLMDSSISYMDGGNFKENFYHGMVLGMLNARKDWIIKSNREAGNGRADIITYYKRGSTGYIFEFKYTSSERELEDMAKMAIEQIEKNHYEKFFLPKRPKEVICYGIAFYKKQCRVEVKKL